MARTYQVISADGHVETPPESWIKYVPVQHRERAPRLIPLPEGGEGWVIEGQPLLHNGTNITGGRVMRFRGESYFNSDGSPAPGAGTGVQRLKEQDQDGIDAEVLFPPIFATKFLEGIQDRGVYLSMVQAYNTFLAEDFCAVAPDRLIGNGVIPFTGIDDAIDEMKRCKDMGIQSVSFHQFPNGSGSPKPEDDRFWAAALDIGIALSPHGNFGDRTYPAYGNSNAHIPLSIWISQRSPAGPTYCIGQLLTSGVFDRFPDLRLYFAETNASWMPSAFFFLDDSYEMSRDWYNGVLKMAPSEYIAKHCYFSFIRDPLAMRMRDLLPIDNMMWGSDFPHSVGSFPESQAWIETIFDGVPPDIRRKVLLETPAAYFGLDLEKPITPTPA